MSTPDSTPKPNGWKAFLPLLLFFVAVTIAIPASKSILDQWKVDSTVLLGGNGILFIAIGGSFYFYFKSLTDKKPHAFLTMVYMGLFIKMLLCLFASFLYIYLAGKQVNKPAVVGCLLLYFVYTALELFVLLKAVRPVKNV